METNQRQSDELNWKIAGIRAERGRIEERLKYLDEQERQLVGGGMTQAPTAKPKAKAKTVRKRILSPETREKMRAAARKRWNKPEPANVPAPVETTHAAQ
jgi:hypothetical protein